MRKERLSPLLQEPELWTPKKIGRAVPTMHGRLREDDNVRLRSEGGALDELRVAVLAERVRKIDPCASKLSIDTLPVGVGGKRF